MLFLSVVLSNKRIEKNGVWSKCTEVELRNIYNPGCLSGSVS